MFTLQYHQLQLMAFSGNNCLNLARLSGSPKNVAICFILQIGKILVVKLIQLYAIHVHVVLRLKQELYPQFFLELITTQLRFYMVSPQLVLLIILTMQSYKFYLNTVKLAPYNSLEGYGIVLGLDSQLWISISSWTVISLATVQIRLAWKGSLFLQTEMINKSWWNSKKV